MRKPMKVYVPEEKFELGDDKEKTIGQKLAAFFIRGAFVLLRPILRYCDKGNNYSDRVRYEYELKFNEFADEYGMRRTLDLLALRNVLTPSYRKLRKDSPAVEIALMNAFSGKHIQILGLNHHCLYKKEEFRDEGTPYLVVDGVKLYMNCRDKEIFLAQVEDGKDVLRKDVIAPNILKPVEYRKIFEDEESVYGKGEDGNYWADDGRLYIVDHNDDIYVSTSAKFLPNRFYLPFSGFHGALNVPFVWWRKDGYKFKVASIGSVPPEFFKYMSLSKIDEWQTEKKPFGECWEKFKSAIKAAVSDDCMYENLEYIRHRHNFNAD